MSFIAEILYNWIGNQITATVARSSYLSSELGMYRSTTCADARTMKYVPVASIIGWRFQEPDWASAVTFG